MSYTVSITQLFPKHDSWTFGPYDTTEEAAKDANKHCRLVGAKFVGSYDFVFGYESRWCDVKFVYKAEGQLFDGIDGFRITIDKLDKNLGVTQNFNTVDTSKCFGVVDELRKCIDDTRRLIAKPDKRTKVENE